MENPAPATPIPYLPFEKFVAAVGDPLRWRIVQTLAAGDPLMVIEIADRLGRSPGLISKHLARLRAGGLVVQGQARLYRIPKVFLQTPGTLDFGHCQLPVVPLLPPE
jgi:DNA-binding transcriptional ArsR family regulator